MPFSALCARLTLYPAPTFHLLLGVKKAERPGCCLYPSRNVTYGFPKCVARVGLWVRRVRGQLLDVSVVAKGTRAVAEGACSVGDSWSLEVCRY